MAFYEFDADTPKNTTKKNPKKTAMRLHAGIVHFVAVQFPSGCIGLAHARIRQGGFQIWPRNQLGSFKSDGQTVRFNEFFKIEPGEGNLTLETWNTDTVYSHKITVRIGILQPDELFPEIHLADLIRLFFSQFRRR